MPVVTVVTVVTVVVVVVAGGSAAARALSALMGAGALNFMSLRLCFCCAAAAHVWLDLRAPV